MYDHRRILDLLGLSHAGQSLPRAFYRDPDIYEFDVEEVFPRSWLMIGFEAELPEAGAYLALTIGVNPILVVRGQDGTIRGFHNVCRHRGSQICADGHGRVAGARLTCPYHGWTYDQKGRLIGAGRMGGRIQFEQEGLRPLPVRLLSGCIYVALTEEAPDFDPFEAAVAPLLEPYRLRDAKLAHESVLIEKANWKLVLENGRECYHCPSGHPELKRIFPVDFGQNFTFETNEHTRAYLARMASLGLPAQFVAGPWWQAGRYPLNPGVESFSMDGKPLVRQPLMAVADKEIGGLRWATEPNSYCHVYADHAFMFSLFPVGPHETKVISKWLVHKDAVENVDYDVKSLIELWTRINTQDCALTENNQRGVDSIGYCPGTYSEQAEDLTIRFVNWYRAAAQAAAQSVPRSLSGGAIR